MSKELIVKANALVEASYHLSANEQRLILSAIAQMGDKPITDNEVYYVSAKDMEALGVIKQPPTESYMKQENGSF